MKVLRHLVSLVLKGYFLFLAGIVLIYLAAASAAILAVFDVFGAISISIISGLVALLGILTTAFGMRQLREKV